MPLVGPPLANRLGERNQGRPDAADGRCDDESEDGGSCGGEERHEQRPHDERDLLQRRFERVGSRAHLRVAEHPRPQGAKRRADRRHERSGSCGTDCDRRERRLELSERTDPEQKRREDHRARKQDPRLATSVDQPARDRRARSGRHEVGAGDQAGRGIAAAVLADEEQQRQSDHPHRQPRK